MGWGLPQIDADALMAAFFIINFNCFLIAAIVPHLRLFAAALGLWVGVCRKYTQML
jgi:hypothetical protein